MKDRVEEILDSLIAAHSLDSSLNIKEEVKVNGAISEEFPDRKICNDGKEHKKERVPERTIEILFYIGLMVLFGLAVLIIFRNASLLA